MKRALLITILAGFATVLVAQSAATRIPQELVGHWQLGSFAMTNFWNPATGQYAGNAGEGYAAAQQP